MSNESEEGNDKEKSDEINETAAENIDEVVDDEKDIVKEQEEIVEEKSGEHKTVASHVDKHLHPMSKRMVDKTVVNEEVRENVPTYEEETGFWNKIKKIFRR